MESGEKDQIETGLATPRYIGSFGELSKGEKLSSSRNKATNTLFSYLFLLEEQGQIQQYIPSSTVLDGV